METGGFDFSPIDHETPSIWPSMEPKCTGSEPEVEYEGSFFEKRATLILLGIFLHFQNNITYLQWILLGGVNMTKKNFSIYLYLIRNLRDISDCVKWCQEKEKNKTERSSFSFFFVSCWSNGTQQITNRLQGNYNRIQGGRCNVTRLQVTEGQKNVCSISHWNTRKKVCLKFTRFFSLKIDKVQFKPKVCLN